MDARRGVLDRQDMATIAAFSLIALENGEVPVLEDTGTGDAPIFEETVADFYGGAR